MKRSNAKALYAFAKKQKLKDSRSTKDLNDSLDGGEELPKQVPSNKKPHFRTQSCPSIEEPLKYSPSKRSKADVVEKEPTVQSYGGKNKILHRHCHSQASLYSGFLPQQSISVENLSTILYRKSGKQGGLKKMGAINRSRQFVINNDQFSKARLQQQMRAYQLSEQLRELDRKTSGITIKQQILQNLLQKYEYELS